MKLDVNISHAIKKDSELEYRKLPGLTDLSKGLKGVKKKNKPNITDHIYFCKMMHL